MFNFVINPLLATVISAVDTWLRASGVDPNGFAPWVALRHYLRGSGKDLRFEDPNSLFVRMCAVSVRYALWDRYGELAHRDVLSDYAYKGPMATRLPDEDKWVRATGGLNEVTATIGGFHAKFKGDHYLIVDRYDWYGLQHGVVIPQVLNPVVDTAPGWLRDKLQLTKCGDQYYMNQAAFCFVGKSYDVVVIVPTELVETVEEEHLYGDFSAVDCFVLPELVVPENPNWEAVLVSDQEALANADVSRYPLSAPLFISGQEEEVELPSTPNPDWDSGEAVELPLRKRRSRRAVYIASSTYDECLADEE